MMRPPLISTDMVKPLSSRGNQVCIHRGAPLFKYRWEREGADPYRPPAPTVRISRGDAGRPVRATRADRADGGGLGLRLAVRDGPPAPDPRSRAAGALDARGQHDPRRAGGADAEAAARADGRRRHVPQPRAARED